MSLNEFIIEIYKQLESLPPDFIGKIEVDKSSFINVMQYVTKPFSTDRWENHHKYVDVHVIIEGQEMVGVEDVTALTVTESYNNSNDSEFLSGYGRIALLEPGKTLILMPGEAHQTGISVSKPMVIRKAVGKYSLE